MNLNNRKPETLVKLAFIHHSCGENWLKDEDGGLGIALMENNYFVSSTNYGWGPDKIGTTTDIGHWWKWFRSDSSKKYMDALYDLNDKNCKYTRVEEIPEGENEIIMFKSCFPNSIVKGDIDDKVPTISDNPLKGLPFNNEFHTVGNIKSIYIDLLEYFKTRQDKLFILVTAPPIQDVTFSKNVRTLNNWLVNEWLKDYGYNNVAVFDFYNILTSNANEMGINDTGFKNGNHHRFHNGKIEHLVDSSINSDTLKYPAGSNDDHPTSAGNVKATNEFIDLINVYYNLWKDLK